MTDNEYTTARTLLLLMTESIISSDKTKSLTLINSRAELDFQLRLALFELGNDRPLPQDNEPLSTYADSLLKVLSDFVGNDNDGRLKMEVPHQSPQPALARNSCEEAESPKQASIRLPETAEDLSAVAQQISGLRNPNSSRPNASLGVEVDHDRTSPHSQTAIREGYDINNVDESERENESNNLKRPGAELLRNRHGSNCSIDHKVPAPVESQETIDKKKAGRSFMRQANEFYDKRIRPLDPTPIKVAVLDTGVDKAHGHFLGVRGRTGQSIHETRSFIGGSLDDTQDNDGHGTEVAALVVKIAPHVGLYIAKVSDAKETLDVGKYVEAIEWAIECGVHIINISAAIKTEQKEEEIRNAIIKAEAQGIIIFAAASNDGGNLPRAFPARMGNVLAIHATDGDGNPWKRNPTALKNHFNFSTLGTGIPSPLQKGDFLKSGTSFSTPIAVGMAANILALAKACLDDGWHCRFAFRKEGMKAILGHASEARSKYHYLCPNQIDKDSTEAYRCWFKDALKKV